MAASYRAEARGLWINASKFGRNFRLVETMAVWPASCFGWKHLLRYKWPPNTFPASREMLDRRWANVVTYVGATSANDVGPTWICPSVQHWHNVVTPTMTLFQRFAKVITYCILLYLMVGTTFAHCLYEWLAKHWHNFIIAHCLSTITIKITSFNCGIIVGLITVLTNKQHKAVNSGQTMLEGGNSHTKYKV